MGAFQNNLLENINYIVFPSELNAKNTSEFSLKCREWIRLDAFIHMCDMRSVTDVPSNFLALMVKFREDLKANNQRVFGINVASHLRPIFTGAGFPPDFFYTKGNTVSLAPRASKRPTVEELKKLFTKYMIQSGYEAMNKMFNSTVAADENYLVNHRQFDVRKFDRASYVSVQNDFLKLHMNLYFEKPCLLGLSKAMTGLPETSIDDEIMSSTATELLNLIYGRGKSQLNDDKDLNMPAAIPKLVMSQDFSQIRKAEPKNLVCVPFASPFGTYYLELEIAVAA